MNVGRFLAVFLCTASLHAESLEVPGSRSPDGRWSLVFEESEADPFVFRARSKKKRSTTELLPSSRLTDDDKVMFECMAHAAQNVRSKKSGAETYHVRWNLDASLLAIEAGAHKFGHFLLFRREGDRFSNIEIPTDFVGKLIGFVRSSPPKIHEMGVNRFREKDPRFGDYPNVVLLNDGYVAFSTYGAQCSGDFQRLPEDVQERLPSGSELYFLLRIPKSGPAVFIGFCH